jgi:hypothetical protein
MTAIICDRLRMSADSMTTDEIKYPSRKIERIGRSLFGFAGDADLIEMAVKWLKGGRRERSRPVFGPEAEIIGLELRGVKRGEPGEIFVWYAGLNPVANGCRFYAIGTGGKAAMAAMICGRSTHDAIAVAKEVDPNTGGEIVTEELWPTPQKHRYRKTSS